MYTHTQGLTLFNILWCSSVCVCRVKQFLFDGCQTQCYRRFQLHHRAEL